MAQDTAANQAGKIALITGSARRIGAHVARRLHARGFDLCLHYHRSADPARALADELNARRPGSVDLIGADLRESEGLAAVAERVRRRWGRLDLLLNNASSFYPTPIGSIDESAWDDLVGSNFKAPLFLTQSLAPLLRESRGCIVNMVDIHALRPLPGHAVYACAKAALVMLTRVLAVDLAPAVRVNAIAPGSILWPEGKSEMSSQSIDAMLRRIPLQRQGEPEDIARAVLYLLDSDYVTGEVLRVDGGRYLS